MTNQLVEAIEKNKRKIKRSVEKTRATREKVEELLRQPLLPFEQEKVYDALRRFVIQDFAYKLAEKYPVISTEIFKLSRNVEMQLGQGYSKGDYTVTVPVVVEMPLDQASKGMHSIKTKGKGKGNNYESDVEVSCSIPEIIPEARIAYSDAVKFSADLVAKSYSDALVSKILLREQMEGARIQTPLDADFNLIWAPTKWEAKLVEQPRYERDPAILMNYLGENFLVYQWDVPEERSLDAMLREFGKSL